MSVASARPVHLPRRESQLDSLVNPSLTRMIECHQLPTSAVDWMHRHRDQPCAFRDAAYLFNSQQLSQIGQLFKPNWQRDPGNILLSCEATLHIQQRVDAAGEADPLRSACRSPPRVPLRQSTRMNTVNSAAREVNVAYAACEQSTHRCVARVDRWCPSDCCRVRRPSARRSIAT